MNQTMTSKTTKSRQQTTVHTAEIVREYGPFSGADRIHGVTHDGHRVWAATGAKLIAFDPESGEPVRALDRACDAGTAFDGKYLYQIAEARIDKIDPGTGDVVASIPAPCNPSGAEWNRVEAHKKFARKLDKSTLEVRKLVEDVATNFASLFSHWQLGRKQYLQHSTSRAFASDG